MSPSKTIVPLEEKVQGLRKQLSSTASVVISSDPQFTTGRWSDFAAPEPGAVVHVATESDVQQTVSQHVSHYNPLNSQWKVSWAIRNDVKFMAQSGGHGYTSGWGIGENDIIINLRSLNSVDIDLPAGKAVLGGGVLVREVNDEAMKNNAMISKSVILSSPN
jgi:FAD/FMN-containing dehydrogenase